MPRERAEDSKMPDGRPRDQQPKWRQDFPVDTAEDEYVARRDFVKFLTLISGAFVIGQVWIGVKSVLRRNAKPPAEMAIARVADVPVGGVLSFRYPHEHDTCLLVRPDEETFLAYDQKCSHLACAVLPDVEKREFVCPCHEGFFDMDTGRPTAGPPRRPLPKILLEIRDGTIYATGVELST